MTNNRNNHFDYRNDNENRTRIYYDDSSQSYRRSSGSKVTRRSIRRDDREITVREPYCRHTEEARAITRTKGRKQNVLIATITLTLAAAIAVGALAISGVFDNPQKADTAPASVSSKVDKGANKAAQPAKQSTQQTQTKQDDNAAAAAQSDNGQTAAVQTVAQTAQDDQTTKAQPQSNSSQSDNSTASKTDGSEDKIDTVNGERIYRDTKRQAPDQTGTPAHYYANGKTSYGFQWDYDTDNGNFVVKCDYNFDQQQYDFTFYGTAPGTAHVTLYYYTSDSNKIPVNLTVTVDDDLNVSVG